MKKSRHPWDMQQKRERWAGLGAAEQELCPGAFGFLLAGKVRQFPAGGLSFSQAPSLYMPPEVVLAP